LIFLLIKILDANSNGSLRLPAPFFEQESCSDDRVFCDQRALKIILVSRLRL